MNLRFRLRILVFFTEEAKISWESIPSRPSWQPSIELTSSSMLTNWFTDWFKFEKLAVVAKKLMFLRD